MICAEFFTTEAGQVVLRPTATQPVDLSTCPVVLLSGADSGALSLFTFPTPTDASTAWVWGFSLVVVSFLAAWGAGAVVNMIHRR